MTFNGNALELIAKAAQQAADLRASINALEAMGQGEFAQSILNEFSKPSASPPADRSPPIALQTAEPTTLAAAKVGQNSATPGAQRDRTSGLHPNELDPRALKNRNLKATLLGDIILLLVARNPGGVVPSDIEEEFRRLNVREPKGTILSRVSRLRHSGWLEEHGDARSSGQYAITAEGVKVLRKAIAERSLRADLLPPASQAAA